MGVGAAPAEEPQGLTGSRAPVVARSAQDNAETRARGGLLRGWVSEPRPPKNHPSCAGDARYVRGKARPIQITVAASDPILLAVAPGELALTSRDRATRRTSQTPILRDMRQTRRRSQC